MPAGNPQVNEVWAMHPARPASPPLGYEGPSPTFVLVLSRGEGVVQVRTAEGEESSLSESLFLALFTFTVEGDRLVQYFRDIVRDTLRGIIGTDNPQAPPTAVPTQWAHLMKD